MSKKRRNIDYENDRYGLFMDENSFNLELSYGRHYLERDVNYLVYIHKINIIDSQVDDLYGQAKAHQKIFLPPIKINGMVDIEENQQENYGNSDGGIAREDTGDIIFRAYLDELEEKQIDIDRGDILEYLQSGDRPRYYEITHANNVVDSTTQTIAGFRPYYKRIIAVPVKEDIVPQLKGDNLR